MAGGKKGGAGGVRGARDLTVRVKTARGRKSSSTKWLQRQLNDPYVAAAKRDGLRSRAAYKISEMDDKLHFLKPGRIVLDLGAVPGGWTQIAVKRTRALENIPFKPATLSGSGLFFDRGVRSRTVVIESRAESTLV